jgi:hypothetical protein
VCGTPTSCRGLGDCRQRNVSQMNEMSESDRQEKFTHQFEHYKLEVEALETVEFTDIEGRRKAWAEIQMRLNLMQDLIPPQAEPLSNLI